MAAREKLPIDPTKRDDAHYRYQMAPVQTKVEGSGNGIKTVLMNVEEIANRLKRPVEVILKFLAKELAVTSKFKDSKHILTGSKTAIEVQDKVYIFITRFVLCRACRNPETYFIPGDTDKSVSMRCHSCGVTSPIRDTDPIANLLLNLAKAAAPAAVMPRAVKRAGPSAAELQEREFSAMTRAAEDGDEVQASPVDTLREVVERGAGDEEVWQTGRNLKHDYDLTPRQFVALGFEALFGEDICKEQIERRCELFKRFLIAGTHRVVIEELIALCEAFPETLGRKYGVLLFLFHQAGVLSDEHIIKWYEMPPTPALPADVQRTYKEKSKQLVDFLLKDDEDDDEEDEEEEGEEEGDDDDGADD